MKRRDLERHLSEHQCQFVRRGGEHDMWQNMATGRKSAVPRHKEVKTGMVKGICRTLGIPLPKGL
ncbi:MAG: type II toxin-antitoxin system HicA family toxin [Planctomycetota bacterium]